MLLHKGGENKASKFVMSMVNGCCYIKEKDKKQKMKVSRSPSAFPPSFSCQSPSEKSTDLARALSHQGEMIDVGHALHGQKPVRRDELIPAIVLEIGAIVQQPFHAGRLLLARMVRLRSRVVGGFADAVSGPDGVGAGDVGRIDGLGLVAAEIGDGMIEMREQPVGRTVRMPFWAEQADRVKEMM